jgi:N-glycosylase/DNA lyase
MFTINHKNFKGREAIVAEGLGGYSLRDTLECGQCFRHRLVKDEGGYLEYMIPVGNSLLFVGQEKLGELIFFDISEEEFYKTAVPYFTLETDYEAIKNDIRQRTDSAWLLSAIESGGGIAILKQDPWEALFSFIVSQNNNIPRIKKIIAQLSAAYGVNLCLQNGIKKCPLGKTDATPCEEICKNCGACYSFPTAESVVKNPEAMLPSKPGFRYKYLLDAATKVSTKETNLDMIAAARSYTHTVGELMKILGVGNKVASCTALFGFGNLEAFPVDVWMKRAIDKYFDGKLDPLTLGRYAGVAQQYIFHYIRNLQEE